jgi:hypothetical protein
LFRGGRKGEAAVDWWSIPHVLSGMALAATGLGWISCGILLCAYEVFEAALRRIKTQSGAGVFEYESWPNIVADVLVGIAGFFVVRWSLPDLHLWFR